jgi:acyl carrier protein
MKMYASLLVVSACTLPANAVPPVPYSEIVDTVRDLAAEQVGRKPAEIDTVRSLAQQGLSENGLHALVIALQQEFDVVIPDDELQLAKWNDPVVGLSVRQLADMVARHQRPE